MTFENYVKGQLVNFAVREAYHCGGVNNMLAVAQVLRNRQAAGWYGGEWLTVIRRAPESVGVVYGPEPDIDRPNLNFRTVLQKVEDIFHGVAEDEMTRGALYYAELHLLNREWFRENVLKRADEHPRLAQVGQVYFFG